MNPVTKALAKMAFETVGARLRADGEPLPVFEQLPDEAQGAWVRAVELSFTMRAPKDGRL